MRPSRPPILVPLLFIVVGVILLLNNFGILEGLLNNVLTLPEGFSVLHLTPVLLVAAGFQLLLRGDIGLTWQSQSFGITRGAVQTASLEAISGELDVKIRALRREGRLIAGTFTGRSRPNLTVRGTHARLSMQRGQAWLFSLADWELGLAKDLPWNMLVSGHLAEIDADLRGLRVAQANFATGVGDVRVILPEAMSMNGGVRVRSTLGNVLAIVPPNVEAVIRIEPRAMARVQVDETRFLMLEPGVYATLGYEQSESVVYAELATTFGSITLR